MQGIGVRKRLSWESSPWIFYILLIWVAWRIARRIVWSTFARVLRMSIVEVIEFVFHERETHHHSLSGDTPQRRETCKERVRSMVWVS